MKKLQAKLYTYNVIYKVRKYKLKERSLNGKGLTSLDIKSSLEIIIKK